MEKNQWVQAIENELNRVWDHPMDRGAVNDMVINIEDYTKKIQCEIEKWKTIAGKLYTELKTADQLLIVNNNRTSAMKQYEQAIAEQEKQVDNEHITEENREG